MCATCEKFNRGAYNILNDTKDPYILPEDSIRKSKIRGKAFNFFEDALDVARPRKTRPKKGTIQGTIQLFCNTQTLVAVVTFH